MTKVVYAKDVKILYTNQVDEQAVMDGAAHATEIVFEWAATDWADIKTLWLNQELPPVQVTTPPNGSWEAYLANIHQQQADPFYCDNETAGKIIRGAAQKIEQFGWVQGRGIVYFEGLVVGYCVVGAIEAVEHKRVGRVAADMFLDWLRQFIEPVTGIPSWNDAPGRTKEEILGYMHKFADEFAPLPAEVTE